MKANSKAVREEDFAVADLALDRLFEPGVAAIELLVADGMSGEKRTTDRDHSSRIQPTANGRHEVVGERLACRGCASTKNVI